MPRYFFHTHLRGDVVADPTGTELPDPDRAWEVAQDTIRTTMAEPRAQARLIAAVLVVTDEDGETVFEFPFAEALAVPRETGGTVH